MKRAKKRYGQHFLHDEGIIQRNLRTFGPFAAVERVLMAAVQAGADRQELHEVLAHALLISAGLHAASAIVMGRIERTRLVKAMVTGVKERY